MTEIKSRLDENGYVFIPAYVPQLETIISIKGLGNILEIEDIDQKQILVPKHLPKLTPNTYSGNYGLSTFPLHTDLAHWLIPPRYFALRCIVGAVAVATHLIDTKDIILAIGRNELRRALVQPRRAINGSRGIYRLLETLANQKELFRWDSLFIQPINEYSRSVIDDVTSFLNVEAKTEIHLINQGDTLILDNWRMLHGRASVNSSSINRRIERVYLEEVFH